MRVWEWGALLRLARGTEELEPEGAASRGRPIPFGRLPGVAVASQCTHAPGVRWRPLTVGIRDGPMTPRFLTLASWPKALSHWQVV